MAKGGKARQSVTTTLSTKGQVIVPKAVRERWRWQAGTRLVVEDTEEGVLLKPAPFLAPTKPLEIYGSLLHRGRPKTLEEMEAAISKKARRRAHD